MKTFEEVIQNAKRHRQQYPSHGTNCACQDKNVWMLRRILQVEIETYDDYAIVMYLLKTAADSRGLSFKID